MTNFEDQRKSPRVPVKLEVQITKGGNTFPGTVMNCSLHGMFVRTVEKLELSDIIFISVLLPNHTEPLTFRSTVIWTDWNERNPGFGVHFVTLSEEQSALLQQCLY